jgi:hypothetical protein
VRQVGRPRRSRRLAVPTVPHRTRRGTRVAGPAGRRSHTSRWVTAVVPVALTVLSVLPAHAQPAATWQEVPAPATMTWRALSAQGDDLWLLGDKAIFRRHPDGPWAEPLPLPTGEPISLAVVHPGLLYVASAAEASSVIHEWQDGEWTTVGALKACLSRDIALVTWRETVAVGCPYYSGLAIWRTGAGNLAVSTVLAPQALAIVGHDDVLFLDFEGLKRVRRDDGANADPAPIRKTEGHSLLWATGRHIVTGSTAGEFLHTTWDAATGRIDAGITRRLEQPGRIAALWGRDADDLFAVGSGGTVWHFNGVDWKPQAMPGHIDLLAIHGSETAVWATGAAGALVRWPVSRRVLPDVGSLNALSARSGEYVVLGYIVDTFECPPCPPDSVCAPCPGPYIVISDGPTLGTTASDRDRHVVVSTLRFDGPRQLGRGTRYRLTVTPVDPTVMMWDGRASFELKRLVRD